MIRDEARNKFAEAGLNYSDLTRQNLQQLRNLINQEMIDSGLIKGSYRCRQRPVFRPDAKRGLFAQIQCRAFYFDDREAVSFNHTGFIGFAGWADDSNIQPVLSGFCKWVEAMKS
ncbi:hypothetical protein [Marinobacterium lutimaris]|uniref:Uncharacterized protein n=1 Tax=Marinobacterium lutimaris TaxID=568106 RepID=A0A1H5XQY2_9GAMM|nr:hypothetical protein [Marinobacterium lutimaris]SEG13810.1 hypothetical protein SAMN05444390_1011462 [Marinobacterium lutimaris]